MSMTGRGNLPLKMQQVQPGKIADLQPVVVPKSSYHTMSKRGFPSVHTKRNSQTQGLPSMGVLGEWMNSGARNLEAYKSWQSGAMHMQMVEAAGRLFGRPDVALLDTCSTCRASRSLIQTCMSVPCAKQTEVLRREAAHGALRCVTDRRGTPVKPG